MDALTAQTVRRLCERLESFRRTGPIPALMAEFRVHAPDEETQPLYGFEGALRCDTLREMPDGARLSRRTWLASDPAVVEDFRSFCEDASRVAVPMLHSVGLHVGRYAPNHRARWLWAVFELAEMRLSGTFLRLKGDDVYRSTLCGAQIGERMLEDAKHSTQPDPFADLIASAGRTRYWRLTNAVEASVAVLDIAQTWQAPAPTDHQSDSTGGKEKPQKSKPKMRPEEHLVVLYMRDPSVATLESRSLPLRAEQEFGERYTDKSYRQTELYKEWRTALEENTRRHGRGWLEGDVLEAGLEIYGSKPGRSDKRGTLDPQHEAAVKAFLRDAGAATARARGRLADGGG